MKNKTATGLTLINQPEAAFYSIAFSPEGNDVACVDWQGKVVIWDARTGNEIKILRPTTYNPQPRLFGAMAFSPDGKTIASGNNGAIVLWDRKTGKEKSVLRSQGSRISALAFASDGKHLAAGTVGGTVHLWNLKNGILEANMAGQEDGVYMVAFSPDAKMLAIPDEEKGHVSLWDVATGKRKKVLKVFNNLVAAIFFSQDGKTLTCSSGPKTGFWDVASGKRKNELKVPVYAPHAIAFSPDGSSVVVGGGNMEDLNGNDRKRIFSVRVLDVKTGKCLQRLVHHTGGVTSVAYSPDGKKIASTSYNGTVRLWKIAK